jgi:hypothetical protein
MKLDPDRCVGCGDLRGAHPFSSKRGVGSDAEAKGHYLDNDEGRIDLSDPFWFCSDECLEKTFTKLYGKEQFQEYYSRSRKAPGTPANKVQQELTVRYGNDKWWFYTATDQKRLSDASFDSLVLHVRELAQDFRRRCYTELSHKEEKEREKEREEEEERLREDAEFQEQIKPRPIPEHLRIHTAVIAKTGWGKTQLLQHLILEELRKPDPPSMVILDSTGAMVDRLQRLSIFSGTDRLLIVDPEHSPALNMFDVSNPRFDSYSPEQKESVQTDLIGLFNYIFASKEYDLSGQQGLGFAYAIRLILSRQGSTLTDLRRLLEESPKHWEQSSFGDDIRALDQDARDFFQHHFYSDSLKTTRASIARRLHALIAIPTFRRMFTAGSNALDLYTETQDRGRTILVNTNQRLLGRDGYVLFGRYIVARTMAAMLERSHIRDHRERRTTHLIIDEAAPYFDQSFDDLLTQVRQYGLKVTIAFQHLDQLDDKLRNSVAGQTSVKYVGGLSPLDERRISQQIRCEPEFVANLSIDTDNPPNWSEWAVYADGLTRHPMRFRLPFYSLEREERISDDEHAELIERNRRIVSPLVPDKPVQQSEVKPPLPVNEDDEDHTAPAIKKKQ